MSVPKSSDPVPIVKCHCGCGRVVEQPSNWPADENRFASKECEEREYQAQFFDEHEGEAVSQRKHGWMDDGEGRSD